MKGKANKVRKKRGAEWAEYLLEQSLKRHAPVITYNVTIEQLNMYLQGEIKELTPKAGRFEVYQPRRKKNNTEVR